MDRKTETRTIWFIGLPCSGKTTLADALALEHPAIRLDGDHVRNGLSAGLGFTDSGRNENIRRCAEVSQLLNEQGHDVICSFITPLKFQQDTIRMIVKNLKIVYVNTPAKVCEERDVKGMWKKAKEGKIKGFTGYDADFYIPNEIDLIIDTKESVNKCVKQLLELF